MPQSRTHRSVASSGRRHRRTAAGYGRTNSVTVHREAEPVMHRPAPRPSRRTTADAHLTVAVSPVHRVHHRRSAGTAVAVGAAALLAAAGPSGTAQATPAEARPATTQRVSVSHTGLQAADSSYGHSISADGRYVVFGSNDSTLVPGDTNDLFDLFVRDLHAGTTTRINVSSTGAQSDANAGNGAISGNGRYVAFASSDPTWPRGTPTTSPTSSSATCGPAPPTESACPAPAGRAAPTASLR